MNKTKIVATIGPASQDKEILKDLIYSGMNVARLNLSHANYAFCKDIIKKIDELNKELKSNVAILLDTKGPEIRVGEIAGGSAYLTEGDKIRIYMNPLLGDSTKFSVNYPGLVEDVKYNQILKVDDGKIELQVIDKDYDYILAEVKAGGFIASNKSVNAPGVKLKRPFLSDKDKEDIVFAHENHVDFLAISFTSKADDILEVNDLLIELGNDHIGIIAKIENESAVNDLDEIVRVSDGIMIARGDLGVEIPMERIPGIQKAIIAKCHNMNKISIVATEMLSSMEHTSRPTRAEVSDVANAVLDGADAVMLSGETTIGDYPLETLTMMNRIINQAEDDMDYLDFLDKAMRSENQDITGSIAYSVAECAARLKCKAIIAPTISGYTARKMSRFRPICPVIAVTPDENTLKSLALHFGVHAILIDELNTFDGVMNRSVKLAKEAIDLEEGDKIIITGGYPFKQVKHTNFMKIEEI